MSPNENGIDRLIRLVVAVLALGAAFAVGFGSIAGWALLAVGAIMLVTGMTGYCPLYQLFRISTCKVDVTSPSRNKVGV